jgi:enoyl-CoA hydratase/carnithine racemase
MVSEPIVLEVDARVATVTLNRPERRNAITGTMWEQLRDVFVDLAHRRGVRVVVVTGAGGAFCSGLDLQASPQGPGGDSEASGLERMRLLGEVMLALHDLPKPTIAKVRGVAAGAGCSLALGCDLIVASDTARFSEIFSKRGLSVDGGSSWLLPRLIGLHRAKELAFFGEILSADEAAAIGLVNRVVPDAELDDFVKNWAAKLAEGPPLALSMTKRLLNNGLSVTMAQALEDEARCQAINFTTEDTREAFLAFAERREPRFVGR